MLMGVPGETLLLNYVEALPRQSFQEIALSAPVKYRIIKYTTPAPLSEPQRPYAAGWLANPPTLEQEVLASGVMEQLEEGRHVAKVMLDPEKFIIDEGPYAVDFLTENLTGKSYDLDLAAVEADVSILFTTNTQPVPPGPSTNLDITSDVFKLDSSTAVVSRLLNDDLHIGRKVEFEQILFDLTDFGNDWGLASLSYWNGSVWTGVSNKFDETRDITGLNSWAQPGIIRYQLPTSWVKGGDLRDEVGTLDSNFFWIRVSFPSSAGGTDKTFDRIVPAVGTQILLLNHDTLFLVGQQVLKPALSTSFVE